MKKFPLIFFLTAIICTCRAESFSENFNTGLPSSASSAIQNVVLTSGTWQMSGVTANSGGAKMNTQNCKIITPFIDKPKTVTFKHKASGNYKSLIVEKSTDNGQSWTELSGSPIKSGSGSFATASLSVGAESEKNVLIRLTAQTVSITIDDFEVQLSDMADEPSQQASIAVDNVTGTTVNVTVSRGNGVGRLIVCGRGQSLSWLPEDGQNYTPGKSYDGVTVVSAGDVLQAQTMNLESGENYTFAVFEYAGESENINYNQSLAQISVHTLEIPFINTAVSQVEFRKVKIGSPQNRAFVISGKYLTPASGKIYLSTSSEVLKLSTSASGEFTSTLNIDYESSALPLTTLFVQLDPKQMRYYEEAVLISCGEASARISVVGEGSDEESFAYYISPEGNDNNQGTYDSPWYNLQVAVNAAAPGDEIIVRGGEYFPDYKQDGTKTTIRLSKSGSAGQSITIRNYEGELPVLNFKSQQPLLQGHRGFELSGDYWHLKGLHITRCGDNAIKLEGNHNVIEKCTFSYNFDTGVQLGFGHVFSDTHPGISSNDGSYCAYNTIIDCDSYRNCDYDTNYGSDADGFACKMHNGKGNRFIRCRAWENSDDAWDLYETDYPVILVECWAWRSGEESDHTWVKDVLSEVISSFHGFSGNGNGIKMGGNGSYSSKGKHEAWNCVAFNCGKSGSVKGFDQNSHNGGTKLVNCLAFGCGYDFMFEKNSNDLEFYNNVCLGRQEIRSGAIDNFNAVASPASEGWSNNLVTGVSAADYESLSEDDAKAPRSEDGALPLKFARLKSSSALVNAGMPMYIPYADEFPHLQQPVYGSGRDMGPYELEEGEISSAPQIIIKDVSDYHIMACGEGWVKFSSPVTGKAVVSLYNVASQSAGVVYEGALVADAEYQISFDRRSLQPGIYFCRLQMGSVTRTAKVVIR